jgi:hypothetical protein
MAPAEDRRVIDPAVRQDEVDVWWGAYASRTMLPSLLMCLAVSVAIVIASVVLVVHYQLPAFAVRSAAYVAGALLWLVQTALWLYRITGFTYRLTTRRLFPFWGFLLSPPPPVPLCEVDEVIVEQTAVERFLKVGRIRLELERQQEPVMLLGILNPGHVAEDIGRCVKACRQC